MNEDEEGRGGGGGGGRQSDRRRWVRVFCLGGKDRSERELCAHNRGLRVAWQPRAVLGPRRRRKTKRTAPAMIRPRGRRGGELGTR